MRGKKSLAGKVRLSAAMAAAGLASVPAFAGQTDDMVTISTSGSTALRAFITSEGPTLLNPNFTITLNSGPGGTPVTYPANDTAGTPTVPGGSPAPLDFWTGGGFRYQLAPGSAGVVTSTGASQVAPAIRFEWHEQGSTEGILELVNDQIGVIPGLASRNPSNDNPLWVNRNRFPTNAPAAFPRRLMATRSTTSARPMARTQCSSASPT